MTSTPKRSIGGMDLRSFSMAIMAFAMAACAAFLVSSTRPGTYEARAFLGEATAERALGPGVAEAATTMQRLELHARIAGTPPVLAAVLEGRELDVSPQELARRVEASVTGDGTLVEIAVLDQDPAHAAALANAIAFKVVEVASADPSAATSLAAAIDADLQVRLDRVDATQRRIERLEALGELGPNQRSRLARLERSLEVAPISIAQLLPYSSEGSTGALAVLNPALPPAVAAQPIPVVDAALAGIVALILVLPLALFPNFLDTRISDVEDVRVEAGVPTLAVIPRVRGSWLRPLRSGDVLITAPDTSAADAYRRAGVGLRMWSPGPQRRVVLVSAPRRDSTKSAVAANLAVALAQAGHKTILLDADLDRPNAHRMLSLQNGPGLVDVLAGEVEDPTELLATSAQDRLWLMSAGDVSRHLGEHIGSAAMKRVLIRLKRDHHVVIDSPPLMGTAAAEVLGPEVDGAVLALTAGRTRRADVRTVVDELERSHATIIGAILAQPSPRVVGWLERGSVSGPQARSSRAPSWQPLSSPIRPDPVDPVSSARPQWTGPYAIPAAAPPSQPGPAAPLPGEPSE